MSPSAQKVSLKDGHAPSSVRLRLSTISMIFFSETAWPIKVKTVCGAFLGRGNEICINGPGHMTKMAALAINQKAYDFVTWHEASNNIKSTTKFV